LVSSGDRGHQLTRELRAQIGEESEVVAAPAPNAAVDGCCDRSRRPGVAHNRAPTTTENAAALGNFGRAVVVSAMSPRRVQQLSQPKLQQALINHEKDNSRNAFNDTS
jgi:hypothetical protein